MNRINFTNVKFYKKNLIKKIKKLIDFNLKIK